MDQWNSRAQFLKIIKHQVKLNVSTDPFTFLVFRIITNNNTVVDSGFERKTFFPDSEPGTPLYIREESLTATYQLTALRRQDARAVFTVELVWNSSENPVENLPALGFDNHPHYLELSWKPVTPQPNAIQLIDNADPDGKILPLNVSTTENSAHYLLLFNSTEDLSSSIRLPLPPYTRSDSQEDAPGETLSTEMEGQRLVLTIDGSSSLDNNHMAVNISASCMNGVNQTEPCEGLFGLGVMSVPEACVQNTGFGQGCQLDNMLWANASDYFNSKAEPGSGYSTGLYIGAGIASVVVGVVGGVAVAALSIYVCAKHRGCRRTVATASTETHQRGETWAAWVRAGFTTLGTYTGFLMKEK